MLLEWHTYMAQLIQYASGFLREEDRELTDTFKTLSVFKLQRAR